MAYNNSDSSSNNVWQSDSLRTAYNSRSRPWYVPEQLWQNLPNLHSTTETAEVLIVTSFASMVLGAFALQEATRGCHLACVVAACCGWLPPGFTQWKCCKNGEPVILVTKLQQQGCSNLRKLVVAVIPFRSWLAFWLSTQIASCCGTHLLHQTSCSF